MGKSIQKLSSDYCRCLYVYPDGKTSEYTQEEIINFTPRQLLTTPVVILFYIDGSKHYFTSSKFVENRLKDKGIKYRCLSEIFLLIKDRFSGQIGPIYDKSLSTIFTMVDLENVMPGICEVTGKDKAQWMEITDEVKSSLEA